MKYLSNKELVCPGHTSSSTQEKKKTQIKNNKKKQGEKEGKGLTV